MISKNPAHQKNLVRKPTEGYHLRPSNLPYESFIVHTTNGAANSRSENELRFLVQSSAVSAHYFISKQGEIFQVLDPKNFVAWHAGSVWLEKYSNVRSIGVEVHFTPAEREWNALMWVGLTRLARMYSHLDILTHREIAKPKGRKIDPSGVTDEQFISWKTSLHKQYRLGLLPYSTNLRRSPYIKENNLIMTYPKQARVVVDVEPVKGDVYRNSDLWYYCNWLGYIHSSLLILEDEV